MKRWTHAARIALLAVALSASGFVAAQTQPQPSPALGAADAGAQQQRQRSVEQPGNNAPVWREVRSGESNYTSIPGREAGVLVQPQARFPGQDTMTTAGEAWRKFRNGPVTFAGGWLLVVALVGIAAFYFFKGPLKLHEPPTGRLMQRFSLAERWAHWAMAISFCVLAVTGLVILFGKHVLLPILGHQLFAWLTMASKSLHNFISPLFIMSLLVFIVMYVRDNLPEKSDLAWFKGVLGMFLRGKHVPSGRFNAGEKTYFWVGVVTLCLVLSVSGVVLLFPNFEQLRTTMQQVNVIHAVAAICMCLLAFGHIYVGTVGIEGALRNMQDGMTDETWAKEHHELWYRDMKAKAGAAPASAGGGASPVPSAPRARD